MLKLAGITKRFRVYDVETTALDSISMEIMRGEFTAVMGPSGCGKSTLLSIFGMLDEPTSGSYEFLGEEVATYPEWKLAAIRKRHVGFVFQNFNLIDDLSVYENVELVLRYQKVNRGDRQRRVEEVLTKMGVAHRAKHLPPQLSGGQQQRVAVARALVGEPDVILADEPTGNLDFAHGQEVMQILQALNVEGVTVVMVTHSEANAQFASRIVNLLDGRIEFASVLASNIPH